MKIVIENNGTTVTFEGKNAADEARRWLDDVEWKQNHKWPQRVAPPVNWPPCPWPQRDGLIS